jgi:hypothetical protein
MIGKPYEGEPHVRFDERRVETRFLTTGAPPSYSPVKSSNIDRGAHSPKKPKIKKTSEKTASISRKIPVLTFHTHPVSFWI